MFCTNCGTENNNGETNCKNCGAPLGGADNNAAFNNGSYAYNQQGTGTYGNQNQPYPNNNVGFNESMIPEEYRPISMWGYFGYQILFALPCVGLILLLVFSFGGTKNKNLKNFARSYFCVLIIAVVLVAIIMAVGGVGFLSSVSNGYY